MSIVTVTQNDIEAIIKYSYTKAEAYTGQTYAEGIRAVCDWLDGISPRPDLEEEE